MQMRIIANINNAYAYTTLERLYSSRYSLIKSAEIFTHICKLMFEHF